MIPEFFISKIFGDTFVRFVSDRSLEPQQKPREKDDLY